MAAQAKSRFLQISAQKLRLAANKVRGKNAKKAALELEFMPKRSAQIVLKTLNSAIANAEQKGDIDSDNLFIKTICVNEGPTMKRWLPRARGMATPLLKRTSHLELTLEER